MIVPEALAVLRDADGRMSALEIAGALMERKGMPVGDLKLRRDFGTRVLDWLRKIVRRGLVERSGGKVVR